MWNHPSTAELSTDDEMPTYTCLEQQVDVPSNSCMAINEVHDDVAMQDIEIQADTSQAEGPSNNA